MQLPQQRGACALQMALEAASAAPRKLQQQLQRKLLPLRRETSALKTFCALQQRRLPLLHAGSIAAAVQQSRLREQSQMRTQVQRQRWRSCNACLPWLQVSVCRGARDWHDALPSRVSALAQNC